MNDLIDEQDLRKALQSFRRDRDAFEAGVRRRMEALSRQYLMASHSEKQSPWLQVAASVMPLTLFSKSVGPGVTISTGKVSLGYKLVGYAAVPALTVLLMIAATLFALVQVRKAQVMPVSESTGAAEHQSAILRKWWKTFGLFPACLAFAALLVSMSGYAFPTLVFFLVSGIAMLMLVTHLGRAGLIDRRTIGTNLMASLIGLTQVMQVSTMIDSGCHLLDQGLVMMILLLAVILLGLILTTGSNSGWRMVTHTTGWIFAAIAVSVVLGQSILNPMTPNRMKEHVESFETARFSSSSWQQWSVPTIWLQQMGLPLDLSKPRALLEAEISGEQNVFILGVASRTGLLAPSDMTQLRGVEDRKERLFDPSTRGQMIASIGQQEFVLRSLPPLSDEDADLLESRLLETIRDAMKSDLGTFEDALTATKLLIEINRPCTDAVLRSQVQRKIVAMQRTGFQLGARQGGFATYMTLSHSDPLSSSAAIELMSFYGVPAELDLMAIRSFLRPSLYDYWMRDASAIREATKMRLESLHDVPPLSLWDFIRMETPILMAMMLAVFCLVATLGCPNQTIGTLVPATTTQD